MPCPPSQARNYLRQANGYHGSHKFLSFTILRSLSVNVDTTSLSDSNTMPQTTSVSWETVRQKGGQYTNRISNLFLSPSSIWRHSNLDICQSWYVVSEIAFRQAMAVLHAWSPGSGSCSTENSGQIKKFTTTPCLVQAHAEDLSIHLKIVMV